MMATSEPRKPEPAHLVAVNNIQVWTDPDLLPRTVHLLDRHGKLIQSIAGVYAMHVGEL